MNNRDTMVFNGKEFEYTTNKDSIDSARETYNDLQFKKQISDLEDQITLLKKTVLNLNDVISDAIDEVNDRSEEVYETLTEYAEQYGITISDEIISAWNGVSNAENGATNALTQFGNTVTSTSSKSVTALNTVKTKVNEIYTSANTTSSALVTMLTPSTTYINEAMAKIQSDIVIISNNANTAKTAMDNWNKVNLSTFNKTTSTAASGVSAVETAAKNANNALSALDKIKAYTDTGTTATALKALTKDAKDSKEMVEGIKTALDKLNGMSAKASVSVTGADTAEKNAKKVSDALSEIPTSITTTLKAVVSNPSGYKVIDTGTGSQVGNTYTSLSEAQAYWDKAATSYAKNTGRMLMVVPVYAQGGKVGNTENPLTQLAQSVGEDKMVAVKHGEEILTEAQSDGWRKFLDFTPAFNQAMPTLTNIANSIPTNAIRNNAISNNAPSITMGDIIVQGVQNADGLAREINTRFPMLMFQESKKKY